MFNTAMLCLILLASSIMATVTVSALGADPDEVPPPVHAGPVNVMVVRDGDGYKLLRDGQPFFIKGAGGTASKKVLREAGANSIRTWGADDLDPVLDEAQRNGLMVTVGIWLGHERHGFNYNSADEVAEQYERVRQTILRYKDNPSVLLWGLGNEMEGYGKGDNAAIWSAINNLASMAHKLDPNHPTMTVVAEIGGERVQNIHRLCPDIDIVGINSYAGVSSIPKRYLDAGGVKPYIVTEFGPPGNWEVAKNEWGAVLEPTSTEKAEFYRKGYSLGINSQREICLGSYAFAWGNKQEATATWFGMLLNDGSRLGAVDVMTELWSGKSVPNRCPQIRGLKLQGSDEVDPGESIHAVLDASDPEGDALKVTWVLQEEPKSYTLGGDAQAAPPVHPEALVSGDAKQAEVRMPKAPGKYRLFAYVYDGQGGAAVANIAVHVKGIEIVPIGAAATLPLVIYGDSAQAAAPYAPTGFMGNVRSIKMNEHCETNPHAGKTCIRVDYEDPTGWGGVSWQNPGNDWGDQPGGWNLTGASRLTFWARGDKGGETVGFQFGLLHDKPFSDTAEGKLDQVKLTDQWQQFSMDLKGKDLTRIKTGFAWFVNGAGQTVTFYLGDIKFE